jgi:tetratricopeptide (TPR) repeat protein
VLTALPVLIVLIIALSLATVARAADEGRILGTVVDASGAPIVGAKIVLTRAGTQYRQEKTSDAKGKFTLLVLDATAEYLLHAEKEGFAPYEETVKPKIGDVLRVSFTLQSAQPAAPKPGEPGGGPTAEEVKALEGKNQAIAAFNEGVTLLHGGDVAAAAPKFEAAVQIDPTLAPAQAALAEIDFDLKKYPEALAAADRYLALEPGQVRGLRVRYDALQAMGDKEKARQALDTLVAADHSRETAVRVYNLGAEASRAGDRDAAAAYLKRALEVDPTLGQAASALGNMYLTKKSYKEALALADQILATQPQSLEALTIKHEALKGMGDKKGAEAALAAMNAAKNAANQDVASLFNQGVAMYNSGSLPEATEAFERVVATDPKFPKAHYMLGLLYSNNGQPDKAREHLQTFLELAPNDPDAATAREMLDYLKK